MLIWVEQRLGGSHRGVVIERMYAKWVYPRGESRAQMSLQMSIIQHIAISHNMGQGKRRKTTTVLLDISHYLLAR